MNNKNMSNKYRYKIHNELYDLTDFVQIHPGGADMFNHLKPDTNITPMVYAYHKNPEALLTILPKYKIPMEKGLVIKYDTQYSYDKYCELKRLVYDEIYKKKIPLHWSTTEIIYNGCALTLYLCAWVYYLANAPVLSRWWIVLLVLLNTGICNLIFHESAHYASFKNQYINKLLTATAYPIMIEKNWKFIHNYSHHCFTNSEHDFDFSLPDQLIRHSDAQKHKWYNPFQNIYSLLIFAGVFVHKGIYLSLKRSGSKNWVCFPVLSYFIGGVNAICWYLLCGLIFAFIAQLSHIQPECVCAQADDIKKKNDFLYNQVSSSVNYRTDDPLSRFLCFGLDIQIEHHLFPNIPHSSLRRVQHVVRDYCEKNDIQYVYFSNMFSAAFSYVKHLYKVGNPGVAIKNI